MKKIYYILFLLSLSCKSGKDINKSDEAFPPFLQKFEQDSIFQASRITFPLLKLELEKEKRNTIQKWVNEKDYQKINLIPLFNGKPNSTYSEEFRIINDQTIVEIRGLDNGKILNYHFTKKNGKWILIEWDDFSVNH